ncbi:MAG: tRNA (adenosine(37)-N6)-threonylcarbamoyltransferase complex transferase subunit TsaD [Armatimonadota bacterium]
MSRILAIESSCDETSAAVVNGRQVLSNVVATQIEMHQKWGGVVPEAAARAHVEAILPVIHEALEIATCKVSELDAIAVTNRPGLVGALSVGVTAAQALAFAHKKPLIGVDHLEGHLLAMLALPNEIKFPCISLLVSGGHSELVLIQAIGQYELLGQTRDDAAGEAYDKGARLLGLGYPGGKQISEQAILGNPKRYDLPRGLAKERYDMSFSGLKTAVLRLAESKGPSISVPDAAASLQAAINDVLVKRLRNSIEDHNPASIALCGGVAANPNLRAMVKKLGEQNQIPAYIPPLSLCTDNAAMIGLVAASKDFAIEFNLQVHPNSALFA